MEIKGKSVSGGIAIGPVAIMDTDNKAVLNYSIQDPEVEIARFDEAREIARGQLKELYNKAIKEIGEESAEVFKVHQMMLDDAGFLNEVYDQIRDHKINGEYAVHRTKEKFATVFASMDDDYMRGRAVDVRDISDRVISIMQGTEDDEVEFKCPVIIFAKELTPSQTIALDKSKVLAFVTTNGSINSHSSILARNMGIPAITGAKFSKTMVGKMAIVDSYEDIVFIDPTRELIDSYEAKQKDIKKARKDLKKLIGKESVTKDGKKVDIFANINSAEDVHFALENDAAGIGLFRTEFLYLESNKLPTEEEQFEAYKSVALAMGDKRVVIRTVDLGADKKAPYLNFDHEENPAMGLRGIRYSLTKKDLFKTQLRAIYRASAFGNIAISLPMVSSLDEVKSVKKIINKVKKDLTAEGISYGNVELGVVIETPSAALISDELAKEVEFFSIGTNDLSQYTLAMDRQNPRLDNFFNAKDPALMKLMKITIENAHAAGKRVAICGELGSNPAMTETLIGLGFDEISVNPTMVLPLKHIIINL